MVVFILYLQSEEEPEPEASSSNKTLTSGTPDTGADVRKRLFSKELRCMMYGFGDDQNPYTESVDFLEDIVIEFISEVVWIIYHFPCPLSL